MIIVTGGAGFIGSNLVKALQEKFSAPIVVCDALGIDEKWHNLRSSRVDYFVNPFELMPFLNDNEDAIDTVFHMGGISSTTETDADLVIDSNFKLTTALVDWATLTGKRIIYASSASTYGDGAAGFNDDESPESLAKLSPLNVYGWSKHLVDRAIAEKKRRGNKLPPQLVGLKFFNVFGPNEYHKGNQKSVVNHIYEVIKFGNPAWLFKSYNPDYPHGGQKRDFIWVGDCVEVMLWLYDHPEVSGLFNVGTGTARTFDDLAKATFAALGRTPRIEYIEMPQGLPEKYQYFTEANMSKLQAAGYNKPFTSLEEGVRKYVQDFLMQQNIYN
jgi:ADP-L-glycero-D-manno-heptose 6-epimerase